MILSESPGRMRSAWSREILDDEDCEERERENGEIDLHPPYVTFRESNKAATLKSFRLLFILITRVSAIFLIIRESDQEATAFFI